MATLFDVDTHTLKFAEIVLRTSCRKQKMEEHDFKLSMKERKGEAKERKMGRRKWKDEQLKSYYVKGYPKEYVFEGAKKIPVALLQWKTVRMKP